MLGSLDAYEGEKSSPVVFIYTCPSTSKIKERMVYASSRSSIISMAEQAGLTIAKKVELSAFLFVIMVSIRCGSTHISGKFIAGSRVTIGAVSGVTHRGISS